MTTRIVFVCPYLCPVHFFFFLFFYFPVSVFFLVLSEIMYATPSTSILSRIPVSFSVSDSMTVSALVFCLLRPMSLCVSVCVWGFAAMATPCTASVCD